MPALSIRLLGPLDIASPDGRARRPGSHKAVELLGYLLVHRGRPVRREALSCVLWPDVDPPRRRKSLRQALWQLQSAIGRAPAAELLQVTPDTLHVRSGADVWLDVAEFRRAIEELRDVPAEAMTTPQAAFADRAITLYRGDLLDDLTSDWCLVDREWLRGTYLTALEKLMVHCEAQGEYERGVGYGERILAVDRAREYTHRRMIRLHHLNGDRTGALRQFDRCTQALDEELAVRPAEPTMRLWKQVRDGGDSAQGEIACPSWRYPSAVALRLRRLQQTLADLQGQLQAELSALESAPIPRPSATSDARAGVDADAPSG